MTPTHDEDGVPSATGRGPSRALPRLLTLVLGLAGSATAAQEADMSLKLTSPAFDDHGHIPREYTCEGQDVSPELAWDGVPEDTRSFVLIVDDPDAPDPADPRMTWVHWLVYDLPPETRNLPRDAGRKGLPAGTHQALNDWGRQEYGGPCPPVGRHRYFHKLYALDTKLGDLGGVEKNTVAAAMQGHVLASTELVGTYQKGK